MCLTAWQALAEFGNLQPGQTVLIQAGSGGLGSVAISIAKHLGATVYTTCSQKNIEYVRARVADHVIDYQSADYVSIAKQKEPDGLDMVLESLLSDATTEAAINLVRRGGTVAYMNNEPPQMRAIDENNIKAEFLHHRPDGDSLGQIMTLFESGALTIPHIEVVPLDNIRQAHERSEAGHTKGKLVLHIQDL